MGKTLILCEKPDAALRLAEAIDKFNKPKKIERRGVPYYEASDGEKKVLVCSALGHLYGIDVKGVRGRRHYPVWDFTWKPKHEIERGQKKQELWLKTINELSEQADLFINACDYDIEGSLIGYMILKYACGGADSKARRMKFSTLTPEELCEAYVKLHPQLDYPLVNAGMCRHEVDWLYGINISRALTESAYSYSARYATLSTGRVQGPTMRFIVDREKELLCFAPSPYWMIRAKVEVDGAKVEAEYELDRVEVLEDAEGVVRECSGKKGLIQNLDTRSNRVSSPNPFDLPSLQAECYRHFGFTPSQTLGIAERLYLDALTSYPRTSSQKLPPTIGYREILEALSKQPNYRAGAEMLLSAEALTPNEGGKTDPAHPAIYPTGVTPKRRLESREQKLYDLIVKRFMATFGSTAVRQSNKATIRVGRHTYYLRGSRLVKKGWIELYEPYSEFEEVTLPPLKVGQEVLFKNVFCEGKFTQPPPRYNPSSLLRLMEDENIGTKATRADIVDTLYRRGYIKGERIEATPLAFNVTKLLLKHCPKVLDVSFTRELEGMMENIELGKESREHVVLEAVEQLRPVIASLKESEKIIGKELSETIRDTRRGEITLSSPCPECGSKLMVIKSRKTGKQFIGCSGRWERGCSFSLPLPQFGKITLLSKNCNKCGFQLIQAKTKGRRPFVSCSRCFAEKIRVKST